LIQERGSMSEKKPVIILFSSERENCPVCGKPSYSPAGTHPQCALARADAASREDRKAAEVAIAKLKLKRKSWTKRCPKCKREIAARRMVCDCGHKFAPTKAIAFPNKG
jgi:hypothetical protein